MSNEEIKDRCPQHTKRAEDIINKVGLPTFKQMSEKKTPEEIFIEEGMKFISDDHKIIDEAISSICNDPYYKDELQIYKNALFAYASEECAERDKRIAELEGKLKKIDNWNKDLIQHSKEQKSEMIGYYKASLNAISQTLDKITENLTELLK